MMQMLRTYSRRSTEHGKYDPQTGDARVELVIPDYFPGGAYKLNFIKMKDIALNAQGVYFTDPGHLLRDEDVIIDEVPATIVSSNDKSRRHPRLCSI